LHELLLQHAANLESSGMIHFSSQEREGGSVEGGSYVGWAVS